MDGAARLDDAPAAAARRRPAICRSSGAGRAPVARTLGAQVHAAVDPPSGSFDWRYANTPHELRRMWTRRPGERRSRAARVMKFQNEHGMTVDGVAGRAVWRALMADEIAGRRQSERLQLRLRAPRSARRS